MIFDALSDKNSKNPICDMIAFFNRLNLKNIERLDFEEVRKSKMKDKKNLPKQYLKNLVIKALVVAD